eukprot:COSAG02_NODE_2815_length_7969_cov_63.173930_3_plen_179_part_00
MCARRGGHARCRMRACVHAEKLDLLIFTNLPAVSLWGFSSLCCSAALQTGSPPGSASRCYRTPTFVGRLLALANPIATVRDVRRIRGGECELVACGHTFRQELLPSATPLQSIGTYIDLARGLGWCLLACVACATTNSDKRPLGRGHDTEPDISVISTKTYVAPATRCELSSKATVAR